MIYWADLVKLRDFEAAEVAKVELDCIVLVVVVFFYFFVESLLEEVDYYYWETTVVEVSCGNDLRINSCVLKT